MVLAAGRSRRFGRRNKLLTPLHGRPLWWWALAAAFTSQAQPLVVVLGSRPQRMLRSLAAFRRRQRRGRAVRVVINCRSGKGMASSLQAGLAGLSLQCAGSLVLLADMPSVRTATIDALIAAWQPGDAAVVPTVRGRRGNPVLLSSDLFGELAALRGDEGAKRVLRRVDGVRELAMAGGGIAKDVDTRRDHTRLRRAASTARQMRRPCYPL